MGKSKEVSRRRNSIPVSPVIAVEGNAMFGGISKRHVKCGRFRNHVRCVMAVSLSGLKLNHGRYDSITTFISELTVNRHISL